MNTPVLSSTLLLTLLLLVGLFFFIRASVKDRTQVVRLISDLTTESLAEQLQQYFVARSYQVTQVNAAGQAIAFEGIVRPSVFLAIFLTLLAGIGAICLSLVISTLDSDLLGASYLLVLLSPLAGIFYWRKAKRPETVQLKFESTSGDAAQSSQQSLPQQSVFTIKAHRDELLELQQALPISSAKNSAE